MEQGSHRYAMETHSRAQSGDYPPPLEHIHTRTVWKLLTTFGPQPQSATAACSSQKVNTIMDNIDYVNVYVVYNYYP